MQKIADQAIAMIDTQPIEVCQCQYAKNSETAQPFVSKCYCALKKKYYTGAKLQIIAQRRRQKLPFPREFALASAAVYDLEIAKETLPQSEVQSVELYGDKAYIDQHFQLELFETKAIQLKTANQKEKGTKAASAFPKSSKFD